jgi:hypothetical protein
MQAVFKWPSTWSTWTARVFMDCPPEGGRGRLTHADHQQRRDCRVKAVRGLYPAHPKGLALMRQSRRCNLVAMSKWGGGLGLPGVIWPGVWACPRGGGAGGGAQAARAQCPGGLLAGAGESDAGCMTTPGRLARALPRAPRFCITRIQSAGRERGTNDHPKGRRTELRVM